VGKHAAKIIRKQFSHKKIDRKIKKIKGKVAKKQEMNYSENSVSLARIEDEMAY